MSKHLINRRCFRSCMGRNLSISWIRIRCIRGFCFVVRREIGYLSSHFGYGGFQCLTCYGGSDRFCFQVDTSCIVVKEEGEDQNDADHDQRISGVPRVSGARGEDENWCPSHSACQTGKHRRRFPSLLGGLGRSPSRQRFWEHLGVNGTHL